MDQDPLIDKGIGGAPLATDSAGGASTGGASTGGGSIQNTEPVFDFPSPKGPVALSDWAEKSAESLCAFLAVKMPSLLNWGNYYPYEEPCVDFFANRFRDRLDLPALVASGDLNFDPVAFGECLTTYSASGNALMCVERLGTHPEGAACASTIECANGGADGKQLACRGVCTALLAPGAVCDSPGAELPINLPCGFGLYCSDNDDMRCHAVDFETAHCNLDDYAFSNCAGGLTCEDANIGDVTGKCLFYGPTTSYWSCSDGYAPVFDPTKLPPESEVTQPCATGPRLGEACFAYFDDSCAHDAYCSAPKLNSEGMCVLRKSIGEQCDAQTQLHSCALGARCDIATNRCVDASRALLGESCDMNDDCYSGQCVEKICIRPALEELDLIWKMNKDLRVRFLVSTG